MTDTTCILAVDDQQDQLKALDLILAGVGYRVLTTTSAVEALTMLETEDVHLILADIAMPHMNGYQLFEQVRKQPRWATIPFLFLTARALDSDVRFGKALGVDDYLTKPIQPEDLLAAIEGKLRRRQHLADAVFPAPPPASADTTARIRVGGLEIDAARHQVWLDGQPISLSVREFALLEHLVRHAGHVVPSSDLLRVTHGLTSTSDSEARELLRPLVRSLRNKLGSSGETGNIETVRSLGYRFIEPM